MTRSQAFSSFLDFGSNSEVYSEPCQTSKMESFAKILSNYKLLSIFAKYSILDVSHGSEYASEMKSA